MKHLNANFSKKAQLKIQQMAFMLVAVFIFFSLAGIFYLNISSSDLENRVKNLREQEALQIALSMRGTPEFLFESSGECSSCIDLDKVMMLKDKPKYKEFWKVDYVMVEKIWPNATDRECTRAVYPECTKITIIDSKKNNLNTKVAFVTLARWDPSSGSGGAYKYELGRIHLSAQNINND